MIHYHVVGYGPLADTARWIAGRHALVSYLNDQYFDTVFPLVQSFVLDNGAYAAWRSDTPFDYDAFVRTCLRWHRHPAFDWAVVPDVIDGDEAENDAFLRAWPDEIRGVPVWHMHESLDRLVRLGHEWPYVALGSSGSVSHPGSRAWWLRMTEAMTALCDDEGRPPCRLHGLRMMREDIIERLPLSSADSATACRSSRHHADNPRCGKAVLGVKSHRVRAEILALRLESVQSAERWTSPSQLSLELPANGQATMDL